MADEFGTVADRIAATTGESLERIESELRKLEARDVPATEAEPTVTARFSDRDGSTAPWELAGVGLARGHSLYRAGYVSAADIADAPVPELAALAYLSEPSATCIREVARNQCGREDTVAAEIAAEVGVPRDRVAEAYEEFAPQVILPSDAAPTLRKALDDPPADSVFSLDVAHSTMHHLYTEGLRTVAAVADVPVSRLETIPYHGERRAERLKQTAEDARSERDIDEPTADDWTVEQSGSGGGPQREPEPSAEAGSEPPAHPESDEAPDAEGYPQAMVERDQWLLWKQTDDGRKIPRAPWETGDPLQFVSAMDAANWTTFADARAWQERLPGEFGLAFSLTRDDDVVFVDLDDVVSDGSLSEPARELLEAADSYAAASTSGTGVHLFVRGVLSEDVKALTGPLEAASDAGSIEVYDRNRFVATTGDHLASTPETVRANEPFLERLEAEYATVSSRTPDRATSEPSRSREELRELETTTEIQDVFDAIAQTRPSDIRMKSTLTREHGDGTASYDPSWVHSDSGTRLGVLEDVWIYREGMIALDALQLVALEEGLITDERTYPEGETFWEALDALRDRGADVPRYEPDADVEDEPDDGAIDEWTVAEYLNYGEAVRTHVHPYDRDYQERLALRLAPLVVDAVADLHLPPAVGYRAATVYATAHAAGLVAGAAHESSLGAALRIATVESGNPRPLSDIAELLGEEPGTIQGKFQRFVTETSLSDRLDASDLVVDPAEYVPYLAQKLGVGDDEALQETVTTMLEAVDHDGGSNPMSEVAGAFYVAMKRADGHEATQSRVARAANLTEVTIRNNYRKYS